jgi:hypothetical protein
MCARCASFPLYGEADLIEPNSLRRPCEDVYATASAKSLEETEMNRLATNMSCHHSNKYR